MKKQSNSSSLEPANFSSKELSKTMYEVFKKEPYIGAILQEIDISVKNTIPTAGIYYNKSTRKYQIDINPYFFDKLKVKERVAVIMHEILHFTNFHLNRMGITSDDVHKIKDIRLRNVAADMSINQYIQDLPDFCVKVSDFKLNDGKSFPAYETYETYYRLLQENKEANEEKMQQMGDNGESLDSHNWEELSDEEKQAAIEEMKSIYKRAIEKNGLYKSTIQSHLDDLIEKLDISIEKFNARKILRNAVKKFASSIDRESTWKRPNKRFGNYAPGTNDSKVPKLNIYIDTSGSRSHTEINADIEIVKKFLKTGTRKCIIGLWHTCLYKKRKFKMRKFKMSDNLLNNEIQSGGTSIDDVIIDINKTKPNLSIVLTDGAYDWNGKYPTSETIVILVGDMVNNNHPMINKIKTIKLNNLK